MKNSGCHGNQTVPYIEVYRIPENKNDPAKKHGFYGRLIFLLLWFRVKRIYEVFRLVQGRLPLLDYLNVVRITSLWSLV